MRGQFLHNKVMADAVAAALMLKGHPTFREHPVQPGQRPPAVDLACRIDGRLVVFEFERSGARVAADIAKAGRITASLLMIVVPNPQLAARIRNSLHPISAWSGIGSLQIRVMTLGAALQWVANNCPIMSARNVTTDMVTLNPAPTPSTEGRTE